MVELLKCSQCKGKGYTAVRGFDGNERVDCDNCEGTGHIEYVATDWEAFEIEVLGMTAEAFNTVAEVEEFLGVAPVAPITVDHPGMTPEWFDAAVKRAHDAGLRIQFAKGAETALVSSASMPNVAYFTTRTSCTCRGGQQHGRCLHRAFLIAHLDVFTTPASAQIAA